MPIFLTRSQLYRLLQRELPEGVYPDGAPSAFFSTADMDSVAGTISTAYGNLDRIHENNFPQTADERINDWVDKVFIGVSFDPGVTLQDLRDRVVGKIRKQPRINKWEVLTLVASYLPPGKYVQVYDACERGASGMFEDDAYVNAYIAALPSWQDLGFTNNYCERLPTLGWKLGVDLLGETTYLAEVRGSDLWWLQFLAYGYEIRIFDYAVTGTSFEQLHTQVAQTEPARSVHLFRQQLDLADFYLTVPASNVDFDSGVDCITQDPASETGYSGLTRASGV